MKKYIEFSRRATDVTLLAQHDVLVRSARATQNSQRNKYAPKKVTVQTTKAVRRRHGNVMKKYCRAINLIDVVRKLIGNCCSFTQIGTQDDLLRSNKKSVYLLYTLARKLRRIFMTFGLRSITDSVLTDENVEDEDEDEDVQKNGDGSGSYSNDEEQGYDEVVKNLADQDGRDNEVNFDAPHANSVQLEEHETVVGHTRDEGGDKGQSEQRGGDDEGEGNGPKHDKTEGDGPEENVSEGDEAEYEDHDEDEHERSEHGCGDCGREDAHLEVADNIVEGGHENDGKVVETGHDRDVKMVDAAQAIPAAD